MLSFETMGWVALWILWGNTALVALAALKRAAALWRRASSLAPRTAEAGASGSFEGRVVDADGPVFAEFRVEQLGRWGAGAKRSILWHDRAYVSRVHGGRVEAEGARIDVPATAAASVWIGADEVERAAACPTGGAFEAAYPQARKAKGTSRDVVCAIGPGRRVFLGGTLSKRGGALALGPFEDGTLVVAAMDPARWCRRRALFVALGFVPAILAGAAGVTALAVTPPVFESLASKAGGLLGLVFFLIVLPAGTAIRDFVREPSMRIVRGRWSEPRTASAPAEEAAPEEQQPGGAAAG